MCNLSDGIEERAEKRGELRGAKKATEETTETIILNMYENKFSLEQISLATKKHTDEIRRIVEEREPVLV